MWLDRVIAKVFGTKNERELKAMRPIVEAISSLEPSIQKLTDQELTHKTIEFKEKLAQGATLDDLLPEAFAVVRETNHVDGSVTYQQETRVVLDREAM